MLLNQVFLDKMYLQAFVCLMNKIPDYNSWKARMFYKFVYEDYGCKLILEEQILINNSINNLVN